MSSNTYTIPDNTGFSGTLTAYQNRTVVLNLTAFPQSSRYYKQFETGYKTNSLIWVSNSSTGNYDYNYKDLVLGNNTFTTDSGYYPLSNGVSYRVNLTGVIYYQQRPPSDGVPSAASFNAYIDFTIPHLAPDAPTNLKATPSNNAITLNWTAPTQNPSNESVTTYNIYKNGTNVQTTASTSTTISGLTNGTSYTFSVSANSAVGEGPKSSTVAAVPCVAPGVPTNLSITPGVKSVSLSWTAPTSTGGTALTCYDISGNKQLYTTLNGTSTSYTITGLNNDTTYAFSVASQNPAGISAYTSSVSAKTPNIPSAPVITSATAQNNSVLLSWTASNNGGSAITRYTITGGPTSINVSGDQTSVQVLNLTNGNPYSFTMTAQNAVGLSSVSNSISVTPCTVPSKPATPTATANNDGSISLSLLPPASNGSSITRYNVSYNGTSTNTTGPSITISDHLTNGTPASFSVAAVNAAGTSPYSDTVSATPRLPPSFPIYNSATGGNGTATLTWSEPNNNGSPITSYNVYDDNNVKVTTVTSTTAQITGLTNGTAYNFVVRAVNAAGEGSTSTGFSVVPSTIPSAPLSSDSTVTDTSIALKWLAPTTNGGAEIDYYTVAYNGTVVDSQNTTLTSTVTGLNPKTQYSYTVVAHNKNGNSCPLIISKTTLNLPAFTINNTSVATNGSTTYTATGPLNSTVDLLSLVSTTGGTLSFSSDTPSVADITSSSLVLNSTGSANITVTAAEATGYVSGQATINLSVSIPPIFTVNGQNVNSGSSAAYTFTQSPGNSVDLATLVSVNSGADLSYGPSSNSDVATLSSSIMTVNQSGMATIPISCPANSPYDAGNVSLIVSETVYPTFQFNGIALHPNDQATNSTTYTFQTTEPGTLDLSQLLSCDSNGTITYSSSDPSIATLSGSQLTSVSTGTVTITVTVSASSPYVAGSVTIVMRISILPTKSGPDYLVPEGSLNSIQDLSTAFVFSSGGAITYTIADSTLGDISGSSIILKKSGTTTLTGTVAATGIYDTTSSSIINFGTLVFDYFTINGLKDPHYYVYPFSGLPGSKFDLGSIVSCESGLPINYRIYPDTLDLSGSILTVPDTIPPEIFITLLTDGNDVYNPAARSFNLLITLISTDASVKFVKVNGHELTIPYQYTFDAYASTANIELCANNANATTTIGSSVGNDVSDNISLNVGVNDISFNILAEDNVTTQSVAIKIINPTPGTVPDAPVITGGAIDFTNVTLSWSQSTDSTIQSYTMYQDGSAIQTIPVASLNIQDNTVSEIISNLSRGTTYTFTVTAKNDKGNSSHSNALVLTTIDKTSPSEPRRLVAISQDGQVTLSWIAPSDDGKSPIIAYRVYRSGVFYPEVIMSSNTSATVTGLTNGTSYTFQVAAVNAIGTGPYSNVSNPVTPLAIISAIQSTATNLSTQLVSGQDNTATISGAISNILGNVPNDAPKQTIVDIYTSTALSLIETSTDTDVQSQLATATVNNIITQTEADKSISGLACVNAINTLNQAGSSASVTALATALGQSSLVGTSISLSFDQTTSLFSRKPKVLNAPLTVSMIVPDLASQSVTLSGLNPYIPFVPNVQYHVFNSIGDSVYMTYDSNNEKINVSDTANGAITAYDVGDNIPIGAYVYTIFTVGSAGVTTSDITSVIATASGSSARVTWINPPTRDVSTYSNIITVTINGSPTTYTVSPTDTFEVTNIFTDATVTFRVQIGVNGFRTTGLTSNSVRLNLPLPCFPQGTKLLTATGYKSVEAIEQGELVVTADGRRVPVVVRSRTIKETDTNSAPYTIPKSSLAPNVPSNTVRLSPHHAIQLRKGLWMLPFAAVKLGNTKVVQENIGQPVTYYHFECPNYFTDNLVIEGGVVVESFGNKNIKKFPYTYNPTLKGFTRAAQASRITK